MWITLKSYLCIKFYESNKFGFIYEDYSHIYRWKVSFLLDEMSDFEERSGIISQTTDWGSWSQSLKDVTIEVHLENVNFCVDSSVIRLFMFYF